MSEKILEIACFNIGSALLAAGAGADRIELCDNFYEGGTTPSYGTVAEAVEKLDIPVNVMIRPRGGDFLYSDAEFEVMEKEVLNIKTLGAAGIVTGFLQKNGKIDEERTGKIVELAYPLEVTFHRAFDVSADLFESLELLMNAGVKRILTSGGKGSAAEGAGVISSLVKAAGESLVIMAGGGVRDKNLKVLMDRTNAREFHSSAMRFLKSEMDHLPEDIKMGGDGFDEQKIVSVDEVLIGRMKKILEKG
jgi:copper homeostasis protein